MKNQFIKNKLNNQPKMVEKKKMSKSQVITFILMIFWTISSLVSWFALFSTSTFSSGSNVLTAYADSVEDNYSNIDIESDLLNSTYLNCFQSTLASNDFDEFSNLDYVFDINGVLNISATSPLDDSTIVGPQTFTFFTMTDKALDIFNQRLLNSQTSCYFYLYIEEYDLNRPYYSLSFYQDGVIVKSYQLRRNISYELTDLQRVEFDKITVSYILDSNENFSMTNCLPVMFFGSTNVTSTIYNICPLYYDNLYTNGVINGVDSPFNLFDTYSLIGDIPNGSYRNYDYKPLVNGWKLNFDYLPNNLSNASFVMNFRKQPFNVKDYSFFISSNLDISVYENIRFNIYNSNNVLSFRYDKGSNGELTEYDINGKSYYRIIFYDEEDVISYDLRNIQFLNLSYQDARKFSLVMFNEQQIDMLFRAEYNFGSLISALVDAPIQALTGLFNFDIPVLNINMYNLATSLITLAVLVFILRLIL